LHKFIKKFREALRFEIGQKIAIGGVICL